MAKQFAFLKAAHQQADWVQSDWPEVALVGRSNVGKSSLINAWANQKIAYVAKKPGKTQTVNFYAFNGFGLVDLPGYGYGQVSKKQMFSFSRLISDYLAYRANLAILLHVCDVNVITKVDLEVSLQLRKKFSYYLVFNKIDKVSLGHLNNIKNRFYQYFQIAAQNCFFVSAKQKTGLSGLISNVHQALHSA